MSSLKQRSTICNLPRQHIWEGDVCSFLDATLQRSQCFHRADERSEHCSSRSNGIETAEQAAEAGPGDDPGDAGGQHGGAPRDCQAAGACQVLPAGTLLVIVLAFEQNRWGLVSTVSLFQNLHSSYWCAAALALNSNVGGM